MTFAYDIDALNKAFESILRKNLPPEAYKWLGELGLAVRTRGDLPKLNAAFVMMPRKTGKKVAEISADDETQVQKIYAGLQLKGWTVDRLARVWLLLQWPPVNEQNYLAIIENLFLSAEMGELVALYSSLPLLAYPDLWKKRCAEGIRSNIGQVLESVICNNPYPSRHLEEPAWNQLVLKAIFTEKPILEIHGLRERRNPALAKSLSDYAHERWAAHREVNPLLWICVAPFIDSGNFSDIQRIFASTNGSEREAAALACFESNFPPAQEMLLKAPELKAKIGQGILRWESVSV